MVDYDGQDALKSYLNGLAWTALTKPTFYFDYERTNNMYKNVCVIEQLGITPARLNHDQYVLNHHLRIRQVYNTKAELYPHFTYLLNALWTLTDADSNYELGEIETNYINLRKEVFILIDYSEIKAIT